jgi:GTP-binding protein
MKDLARIYVKAGDGGDGSVHFLHAKYKPLGGPDGGDGGKGGDVILVADENMDNLVEFNFQKTFVVKNGEGGMGKKMHGKDTDDLEVKVPVGTVVYEISEQYSKANLRNRETFDAMLLERKLVADMLTHGQRFEAAWGGRGGRGNFHFRSSTNQAPKEFEEGKPGDEKWLLLELKVVADAGIVGLPNVGKSSLLKALTNAHPKIAGYPFTTLEPNLGVLITHDKRLVLVDVPGVVEEAWEGKGIGPWFLRHLERTQTLIHVLAPRVEVQVAEQLIADYQVVRKELTKYGHGLPEKKEIVVVNKMELVDTAERAKLAESFIKETGKEIVWVSAGMGQVETLVRQLD